MTTIHASDSIVVTVGYLPPISAPIHHLVQLVRAEASVMSDFLNALSDSEEDLAIAIAEELCSYTEGKGLGVEWTEVLRGQPILVEIYHEQDTGYDLNQMFACLKHANVEFVLTVTDQTTSRPSYLMVTGGPELDTGIFKSYESVTLDKNLARHLHETALACLRCSEVEPALNAAELLCGEFLGGFAAPKTLRASLEANDWNFQEIRAGVAMIYNSIEFIFNHWGVNAVAPILKTKSEMGEVRPSIFRFHEQAAPCISGQGARSVVSNLDACHSAGTLQNKIQEPAPTQTARSVHKI